MPKLSKKALIQLSKTNPELASLLMRQQESDRDITLRTVGEPGADGHTPTREELLALIRPLMPRAINGLNGHTPSKRELLDIIIPLIPESDPNKPTREEIADLVSSLLPKKVTGKSGKDGLTPTEDELRFIIQPLIKTMMPIFPKSSEGKKIELPKEKKAKEIARELEGLVGVNKLDYKALKNRPLGTNTRSAAHGGGKLIVQDEGTTLNESVTNIDFVGDGVTATNSGRNVTVTVAGGGGSGDVTAAANLGDNLLIRGDGATKGVQNSGITVDDSDNLTGLGTLNTHTIPAGTSTFAITSDNLSVFAATTSAELAGVISDETGTGVLVFGTAPTFTTSITVTGGATIDADGIDLVSGNDYEIDGTAVLNATTLGSAVVASSLTSVGALNSGSITSGFGSIDIGSSALSTTGTITGPSGTWDVGGMDIAASDSYAVAGTDILSDSAGTMTLSNIDALDATTESTIEAAIDTLSNLTTTGALNSGSITSGFGSIDIGSSALSTTGTITGPSGTWDSGGMDIAASDSYAVAGTAILSDSAGTMTLSNVDALDATTEATIEAAIDTLANLTSAAALPWTGMTTGTDGEVPTFDASGNPAFVATGSSGEVLTSNGAGTAPTFQAAAGGGDPVMHFSTDWSVSARTDPLGVAGGTQVFGNAGVKLTTSATISSAARIRERWASSGISNTGQDGSPTITMGISITIVGTDFKSLFGLGAVAGDGSTVAYTNDQSGFKVTRASSGTVSLFATQGDGTTETASSALATVAVNEGFDLILKINGTASIDYFFRQEVGSLSSATNLTTNLPDSVAPFVQGVVSNIGVATNTVFSLHSGSAER